MRPRKQIARDQLAVVLARRGPMAATALAAELGVSVPTLHRMLAEAREQVLSAGRARRARHALRRPLRGAPADLPLYEVDQAGQAHPLGTLVPIHPEGTHLDLSPTAWPVPEASRDGWWDGLPYPLHDMRPQGYMGRQFARSLHRDLSVPDQLDEWSDDDVLVALSRHGHDTSGNLVLGNESVERWLAHKLQPAAPLDDTALGPAYARLAEQAVASGVAGSSAAGEFPKFTALREREGQATPHVLVKFSGADRSATVQRWSDLLVAEHLAVQGASRLPDTAVAATRIVMHAGRTFLEIERFDRHGLHGRSALCSLGTVNAALVGDGSTDWTRLAQRLIGLGLLEPAHALGVERLWWYGRLIANTDMHPGNLSFRPGTPLVPAPVYDMLPMRYAPLPGGEVPEREFSPPAPLPPQRAVWQTACAAALAFWHEAARDKRISTAFRAICQSNHDRLAALADQV